MRAEQQVHMFYNAVRRTTEKDLLFLTMAFNSEHPLTQEELKRNITRRPSLWKRYEGYMSQLKSEKEIQP